MLVGYAHLDAPDYAGQDGDITAELVIHPAHRRQGYGTSLLGSVLELADGHGVRIWAHGDLPGTAALASKSGLTRIRALFQLRMPLAKAPDTDPVFPDGVTVRTFVPGEDEAAWLGVNQRAFAHHPEQGSWTIKDLRLREEEPWFDPDGFFLAERDGRIVGFHWTKVHQPDDGAAPIGEVYVVGVDPGPAGRRAGPGADPDGPGPPAQNRAGRGHALRRRGQHGGGQDVHGARLRPLVDRCDVPAPRALGPQEAAQPQARRPSAASSSFWGSGPSAAATAASTSV